MMKVIGSLTSPFVRKVRVVMAEKKLEYAIELENVWSQDSKIMQANPLGKVACLIMEDGGAIFDSRVIVEYLDTLTPVGKLIPQHGKERAEVKTWEALADGVLDAAINVFLERRERESSKQCEKWMARQMTEVQSGLQAMSQGLGDKNYCSGNALTLADVAVGCCLGWLAFRFPEIQWRDDYENLAKLMDKLSERPSFKDTLPKV